MADKLNINVNDLDVEYKMLLNELDSLNELYDEAKMRLDKVASVPSRANPVFMASQTSNLISIKEKRLNIIKELTNIKKSKIDIDMKIFNTNNKLDEIESGVSKEILDIYRLLNKNDKNVLLEETIENEDNEEEQLTDEDFENILNERLIEEKKNKDEKNKITQTLPSEYSIVTTKDKELYIVDSDYNIIEDCNFDTSFIHIKEFKEKDGEEYGYDEDGNYYEVVEL